MRIIPSSTSAESDFGQMKLWLGISGILLVSILLAAAATYSVTSDTDHQQWRDVMVVLMTAFLGSAYRTIRMYDALRGYVKSGDAYFVNRRTHKRFEQEMTGRGITRPEDKTSYERMLRRWLVYGKIDAEA